MSPVSRLAPLAVALPALLLTGPAWAFDARTGNAPLEVIIPAVDPVFFSDVTTTGGDPSLLLRYTTLIVNGWFDAASAYHPTARPVYAEVEKRAPFDPTDHTDLNVAITAASKVVLDGFFPEHGDTWGAMLDTVRGGVAEGRDVSDAEALGTQAGEAVFAGRLHDGMNQDGMAGGRSAFPTPFADTTGYAPVNTATTLTDPSRWQPARVRVGTGKYSDQVFVTPQYGQVTPYTPLWELGTTVAPPDASNVENLDAYKAQADQAIATTAALTDEQKMLAEFFENKLFSLPVSLVVASQQRELDLMGFIHAFFAQEVAVFDAGIWVWKHKRDFDAVRPFSAIGHLYGDDPVATWAPAGSVPARQWQSYLPVADHPEYPSATACLCVAHGTALEAALGSPDLGWTVAFEPGSSFVEPGRTPAEALSHTFETWEDFRTTCGQTRLWSGVHFEASVRNVQEACATIGGAAATYVQTLVEGDAAKGKGGKRKVRRR